MNNYNKKNKLYKKIYGGTIDILINKDDLKIIQDHVKFLTCVMQEYRKMKTINDKSTLIYVSKISTIINILNLYISLLETKRYEKGYTEYNDQYKIILNEKGIQTISNFLKNFTQENYNKYYHTTTKYYNYFIETNKIIFYQSNPRGCTRKNFDDTFDDIRKIIKLYLPRPPLVSQAIAPSFEINSIINIYKAFNLITDAFNKN